MARKIYQSCGMPVTLNGQLDTNKNRSINIVQSWECERL